MATDGAVDGGAGGKFRKRPFRRGPSTPYDRPPSAARLALGLRDDPDRAGGWLARLVDPASRMIATSASRLFSSVFRKRLGPPAPSQAPHEVDLEKRGEVHGATSINPPMPKLPDEGDKYGKTFKCISSGDGISELEQLLNQKTFTRDEFERLTELLRSRTVGLPVDVEAQHVELRSSKQPVILDEEKADDSEKEKVTPMLFGKTPKAHSDLNLSSGVVEEVEERIASPTELAKAYMGSKSSKPALPLTPYAMTRRESATSSSPQFLLKSSESSIAQRSSTQIAGYPVNGLRTPRSQGRSALYKMSRSPYFKSQATISDKRHELSDEGYDGFTKSQSELSLSAGKQALKRRSSVLDSDLGSIGPIRRIRQKSNLASSSKELIVSSTGRYLPSSMNGPYGTSTSTENPYLSDKEKYKNVNEDGVKRGDRLSFVPHQSSQMADKILQVIDQLVPSPTKKVSELKVLEESPPKLTTDMLNKQALKSVKEIDSANLFNVDKNGRTDGSSGSFLLKGSSSHASPIQGMDMSNMSTRSLPIEAKVASETGIMDGLITPNSESKHGKAVGSMMVPHVSLQKKPAFKMQISESSLEWDTDSYGGRDASGNMEVERENSKLFAEKPKIVASDGIFPKVSFVSSSNNKPDSVLKSSKQDIQKIQVQITRKDNGFMFPVASTDNTSQVPPTPSMPAAFSEQREPPVPVFSFGSRSVPPLNFSQTATLTSDSSGLKFGIPSNSKKEISASVSFAAPAMNELPSAEVTETDKVNETFKPAEGLSSSTSTSTTAPVFSFGGSSSASLSNGALKTALSAPSVSVAPTSNPSENSAGTFVSSGSASSSAWISPTMPASVKVPLFGATSAVPAETSAATDLTTVGKKSKDSDSEPLKAPNFGASDLSSGAPATSLGSGSSTVFSFGLTAPSPLLSSTSGQLFGLQPSQAAVTTAAPVQTEASTFSSSALATTTGSSPFSFGSSSFGSSGAASKSFSFGLSSSSAQSSSIFTSNANASGSSTGISFAPSASATNLFGSSSSSSFTSTLPGTNLFSSSSSSSFPSPSTTTSLFSSSASQASSSIFGFGSSTSSQSNQPIFGSGSSPAVFSFGPSTASSATPAVAFGTSSTPFSFTMAAAATTSTPVFGVQTPISFGNSPGNDQMNVEDSMTEDTAQPALPATPAFGLANPPMASNSMFGSSPVPSTGFQFGSQPTPAFQPTQSPFQTPSNLEFTVGGSFSLGSGGGDKSGRRIVKVKRDKLRKK